MLQIGDMHFPDNKGRQYVDLKDKSAPVDLVDVTAANPLRNVMHKASKVGSVIGGNPGTPVTASRTGVLTLSDRRVREARIERVEK